MKKLLCTALCLGAIALASCAPTVYKADDGKKKLDDKGYTTVKLTEAEAKLLIVGLKYEVSFTDAISANKGKDADHDIFLAFYFKNNDEAQHFMEDNDNTNMGLMQGYGKVTLGENLGEVKVGYHNNVAYVGSETSFKVVF